MCRLQQGTGWCSGGSRGGAVRHVQRWSRVCGEALPTQRLPRHDWSVWQPHQWSSAVSPCAFLSCSLASCLHTHTRAGTHTHTCTCSCNMHTSAPTHTHMHLWTTHTHTHTHRVKNLASCLHTHTCRHTHMQTLVCADTHMHLHLHTHAHTHTYLAPTQTHTHTDARTCTQSKIASWQDFALKCSHSATCVCSRMSWSQEGSTIFCSFYSIILERDEVAKLDLSSFSVCKYSTVSSSCSVLWQSDMVHEKEEW